LMEPKPKVIAAKELSTPLEEPYESRGPRVVQ
jgi:hypothetical protein